MFGGNSGGGLFGDLPSAKKKISESDSLKKNDNAGCSSATTAVTKKSMSLVDTLGNAGTSMAFVPTSLVRKRNHQHHHRRPGESKRENAVTVKTITLEKSCVVSEPKQQQEEQNIEEDKEKEEEAEEEEQGEPEHLRILHASVTDPYDPLVPNDYLAYRERKRNERRREELEKSTRETLRLQQKMRERIEEERKRVEATGDYDKIAQNRIKTTNAITADSSNIATLSMGRGRGRGVTNLPAWLVKRQQQEEPVVQSNSNAATSSTNKTLVLLSNMTSPGEIDDDLSSEVKEECELQCGPVQFVKIVENNDIDQVQVFVQFTNTDHAQKASKLFHGRRFANRVISATLLNNGVLK